MGFLNLNLTKPHNVTLTVTASAGDITGIKASLEKIAEKLTPQELDLLARAVQKPLLKSQALQELKKRL